MRKKLITSFVQQRYVPVQSHPWINLSTKYTHIYDGHAIHFSSFLLALGFTQNKIENLLIYNVNEAYWFR
jgi:hypothetical protein